MILSGKTEGQPRGRRLRLAVAGAGAGLVAGCFAIAYALSVQSF